jgi:hypothetical protein
MQGCSDFFLVLTQIFNLPIPVSRISFLWLELFFFFFISFFAFLSLVVKYVYNTLVEIIF